MSEKLRKLQAAIYSEVSQGDDDESFARLGEWARKNPRLGLRLGRLGMHYAISIAPSLVMEVMNLPYTMRGIEVIGAGGQATVIYDNARDEVYKIIRATEDVSSAKREEIAKILKQQMQRAAEVHGSTMVPTKVSIESHPLSSRDVVVMRQEFLAPDLELPHDFRQQLQVFGEKSLDELLPDGLLPDVVDPSNLMVVDGNLLLLDTALLDKSTTFPLVFESTQTILEAMAKTGSRSLAHKK